MGSVTFVTRAAHGFRRRFSTSGRSAACPRDDGAEVTKVEIAARMQSSRVQVDRLLDPKNSSATLETLMRAAKVLGRRLRLELV